MFRERHERERAPAVPLDPAGDAVYAASAVVTVADDVLAGVSQRRGFHAYVDEFQNFATDSFATILLEARKYRLSLTLANRYLDQIDEQTAAALFGNLRSYLVFYVGARDASVLSEQLGGRSRRKIS